MKDILFALVLTINGGDSYVLDYNLTAKDCQRAAAEFPLHIVTGGAAIITCEREPIRFGNPDKDSE